MKKGITSAIKLLAILSTTLLAGCLPVRTDKSNDLPSPSPSPSPSTSGTVDPMTLPSIKRPKELKHDYNHDELDYQLVWHDEFDYSGQPDPEKWGYDTGGHGFGNNELQYYTAGDNVAVAGGKMVIAARHEDKEGMKYTSTRLVSKGKGAWQYGRIEVRAKLPGGRGTWPAIWMLPADWGNDDWPAAGEIDIMEHVGYDMNLIHGTVHTEAYNHVNGTQKGGSVKIAGVTEEFHIYAIEWLPDKIKFFVDDEQYYEFDPLQFSKEVTGEQWPFDKPFNMIINIAVGGNWGGAQGVDDSIFPQTLEIDYVRVYQAAGGF